LQNITEIQGGTFSLNMMIMMILSALMNVQPWLVAAAGVAIRKKMSTGLDCMKKGGAAAAG